MLTLGNTHIRRDWGWAPEYVEAMWKMLRLEVPEDFVIATNTSHSLEDFVRETFSAVDLDWREYTRISRLSCYGPRIFRTVKEMRKRRKISSAGEQICR